MGHVAWAGLDVGVEMTSICVIDDVGEVVCETTCPTDLPIVQSKLESIGLCPVLRIGLEASGSLSLARGLRSLGYSVDAYETRQLSKFLRLRRNKTDAGDAIGIAEAGRLGASLISKVHLKNLESQSLQSQLTMRRFLIRQRVATVNLLCRQIEIYGGRIRTSGKSLKLREAFTAEITKLFGNRLTPLIRDFYRLVEYCEKLISYQYAMDSKLKILMNKIDVCRRFKDIPGVGPICALSFYAAVEDPHRFTRSSDVGAYFGLTPRVHQSGLTTKPGRISRMGNSSVRSLLVASAVRFMRHSPPECELRKWATNIEQRRGKKRARVALARKIAVIMLSMWKRGENYGIEYRTGQPCSDEQPRLSKFKVPE
jgi:transposase